MLPSSASTIVHFRESADLRVFGAVSQSEDREAALERISVESLSDPRFYRQQRTRYLIPYLLELLAAESYKTLEETLAKLRLDQGSRETSTLLLGILLDECIVQETSNSVLFVAQYWADYVEYCEARKLPLIYLAAASEFLETRHVRKLDALNADISYPMLVEVSMIRLGIEEMLRAVARFTEIREPPTDVLRYVHRRAVILAPQVADLLRNYIEASQDNPYAPVPFWIKHKKVAADILRSRNKLFPYSESRETDRHVALHEDIDRLVGARFRISRTEVNGALEKHFRRLLQKLSKPGKQTLDDNSVADYILARSDGLTMASGPYSNQGEEKRTLLLRTLERSSQADKQRVLSDIYMLDAQRSLAANHSLELVAGPAHPVASPDPADFELGGERMLLDDGTVSWFRGSCDYCLKFIRTQQHALRLPWADGGWRGCYCSFRCMHSELDDEQAAQVRREKATNYEDAEFHTKIEMQRRMLRLIQSSLEQSGIVVGAGSVLAQ